MKNKKYFNVIAIITLVLIVVLNLIIMIPTLNDSSISNDRDLQTIDFNENWQLTTPKQESPLTVTLPHLVSPATDYKDWIIIENIIPETSFSNLSLLMTVFQKNFLIYIDDELFYTYTPNVDGITESPGSGSFIVELSDVEPGQKISIQFQNLVTADISRIQKITLFDVGGQSELLHFYSSIFLLITSTTSVFGIVLFLFAFTKRNRRYNPVNLMFIAGFLFFSGIWIACNSKFIQVFSSNLLFIHKLELSLFYSLPVLLWGMIYTRWESIRNYVLPILVFMTLLYITFLSLDAFQVVDIGSFLTFFTRSGYLNIIILLVISVVGLVKKIETYEYFIGATFVFIIIIFLDLTLHFSYSNTIPVAQQLLYGVIVLGTVMALSYLKGKTSFEKDLYFNQVKYETSLISEFSQLPSKEQLRIDQVNYASSASVLFISIDTQYEYLRKTGIHSFESQVLEVRDSIIMNTTNKGILYQINSNLLGLVFTTQDDEFNNYVIDTIDQSLRTLHTLEVDFTLVKGTLKELYLEQ